MRTTLFLLTVFSAFALASCRPRAWDVQHPTEQEAAREELERFERLWLNPAHIAPPNIPFERREQTDEQISVAVRPLRPEDADWNTWPGDAARLFNNRAALLFDVEVVGRGSLKWVPEATSLELNTEGDPMRPAHAPDEVLLPLLRAALVQEQWALKGDLVERTRAAGSFRAAYLSTEPARSPLRGVVAFPLRDPERHVIALRITVAVEAEDGPHQFSFLY
ncbi:MAG: hypothetical protein JRI25_03475 [Deltaproteobacteria bacterium]|nr:hypothetical protein [Deltaproteobacteria bacterium]MBW2253640.1 hypothetical protein [Deltaproteobacteria bacterium]